jgi:hypothetical protein
VANVINGDTVNVASGTGGLAGANAGSEAITSFGTLALGGAQAANYTLTSASGSVTVNPLAVSLTGTRTYDGTTNAAFGILTVANVVGSDTVNVASGTGGLAGANAGSEAITSFGDLALGNNTAGNYTLTSASGSVTISALAVSLTGSRAYDGTTNAAFGILSVANPVGSDTVTVASGTGGLAGKNVPAQAITSFDMLVLGNNAAGNYTLINASGSVTITPINASFVSGITADDKVYDGTNTATISVTNTATFAGVVSGDDVTLDTNGYSAVFASVDVDTNIAVTVSGLTLDGADATNYTLTGPVILTANITPAPLTVTGITASDKVYDGTTNATVDVSGAVLVGVVDSDTNNVTLETNVVTAAFADPNVGTNKPVTVNGFILSGSAATNYTLTQPTAEASIGSALLTITADDKSKTYGLPNPALTASYSGFVNGEDTNVLTVQAVLSTMADIDSPVDTYPITVSGAAATNYAISYVNGTLTIVPLPEVGNANWDGNQFVFTFPSLAGQTYQVEYNTNLTDSTWIPIGDPISGTGAQISMTNSITEPQMYFRLHILQQ